MRANVTSVNFLSAAVLLYGALAGMPAAAQSRVWNFQVALDDTPIGYHRFTLREQGAGRELKAEARFSVKVLFFTAYQYAHEATERWRGNCLDSISARTDDNGERLAAASPPKPAPITTVSGAGICAPFPLCPAAPVPLQRPQRNHCHQQRGQRHQQRIPNTLAREGGGEGAHADAQPA